MTSDCCLGGSPYDDRPVVMIVGHKAGAGAWLAEQLPTEVGLPGTVVSGAADALRLCRSSREIALAIVHAGQLDDDAHALCAQLVQARAGLPVMMVSDAPSEADAMRSLGAGAIDHFSRPHNRLELLARLRAHLRSQATSLDVELAIGPWLFHPGQRQLRDRVRQGRIWLTAKESRVLRRLYATANSPVPKSELLNAGWGSPDASVHTLQTHIYRLRNKLASGGRITTPVILTVPVGYQLAL